MIKVKNLNGHDRTRSGIEVTVPDIDAIEDAVLLAYNESNSEKAENMIVKTWGYIKNKSGMYCLGVNCHADKTPITDERPYEFGLYPNFKGGMRVFSPWKKISLSNSDVLSLPIKQKLPLEDFVNVWGVHEETFFQQWVQFFETFELIERHQESLRKHPDYWQSLKASRS